MCGLKERSAMIDTARSEYPSDMVRVAHRHVGEPLEAFADEMIDALRHYARENPLTVAAAALGIGFLLGWKLKPW
jgi:hypothetical protein